jgi:phage-related protein
VLYANTQGRQPIKDYLTELAGKSDKDSRIKLNKIDYCFQVLREYGTRAGEPFVKHIEGDVWELRPLSDR